MSRRRPRRVVLIGGVVVVILAAAGISSYAANRTSAGSYRTAIVGRADVTKTLTETGTASPDSQATAGFGITGTVSTVAVKAGQTVTAGQTLATLGTTSLSAALQAAKETTAEAELTLSEAENGTLSAASGKSGTTGSGSSGGAGTTGSSETTATGTGTVATGTATASLLSTTVTSAARTVADRPAPSGSSTAPSSGAGKTGSGSMSPTALIQDVVQGQKQLDTDLTAAERLLATATTECAPSGPPTPTPTPSSTPTSTPTASATPTGSPSPSPTSSGTGSSCISDEQATLRAQQTVSADETSLASAETRLDASLVAAEKAAASSGTSGTTSATGGTSTRTGNSTSSGSSTTTTSTAVTAAQLAAYQAKVDAAASAQAVAQQNMNLATLVSPISGTVMSVGLASGESSSGEDVVVSAPDGVIFTTSVPVTTVSELAVGQRTQVLRDGTSTPLTGTIVAIAAAPDSSGDYAVTVGLTTPAGSIRSGSTATLTISLASATGVLTVPTSALTSVGGVTVVRILSGSTVKVVPVTVGTKGATLTQVTGALTAGEKVVLADLSSAVPASNTGTTTTGGLAGLGGTTTTGRSTGGFGGGTTGGGAAGGRG